MNPASIHILVVDDHPVVRSGLCAILSAEPEIGHVQAVACGEDAVALHTVNPPDITLMDLRMPGIGGLHAIHQIRECRPEARVIVLSTYDGDEDVHRALAAGARGYLLKDCPAEELISAIRTVHAGRRHVSACMAEKLAARLEQPELTSRECDVLQRMAEGLRNKEIAHVLGISDLTAQTHVKNILAKLKVSDRTEAVVVGLQRGIIALASLPR